MPTKFTVFDKETAKEIKKMLESKKKMFQMKKKEDNENNTMDQKPLDIPNAKPKKRTRKKMTKEEKEAKKKNRTKEEQEAINLRMQKLRELRKKRANKK